MNKKQNIKFGLLKYSTLNLGDEIQSIAASYFLPQIDFMVDRETLDMFEGNKDEIHKIILNGWYMHNPERWPPSPSLLPLFISFHLTQGILPNSLFELTPSETLLNEENKEYLRAFSPIGARDLSTLELLERNQIESYFSGCLTLTLPENDENKVEDVIYLVDVDDEIAAACRKYNPGEIRIVSHVDFHLLNSTDRFNKAKKLLDCYKTAKCVITSRLHAALPCLAMKTPVLLINTQEDQYRFSGLNLLVRNISKKDFLAGRQDFNLENPTQNPDDYLRYRHLLTQKVKHFTQNEYHSPPTIASKFMAEGSLWVKLKNSKTLISEEKTAHAQTQDLLTKVQMELQCNANLLAAEKAAHLEAQVLLSKIQAQVNEANDKIAALEKIILQKNRSLIYKAVSYLKRLPS